MGITRANSIKTMARRENSNNITSRSLHRQNAMSGKGNSQGACNRLGKPFTKPAANTMSRKGNLHGGCYRIGKPFPKPAANTMSRKENSHGGCYRIGKPFPKPIASTIGRKGNSHGSCYRVGKTFPKPVTKSVKCGAYTSKRNNIRNINCMINSVPLSSIDSKRQRWNAFYCNGRALKGKRNRIFRNSCTLFCEVTLVNSELHSFWTKSCSSVKEPHAEIKALEEIRNIEKTRVDLWKVDMLLSYSPCANCANAIINFKRQGRLSLQISLAFTAIFQHNEMIHCQGLRHLNSEPGITLRVFTENDWIRLAKETGVVYYPNKSRREQDADWYWKLKEILSPEVVIDMGVDDGFALPRPGFTSSKKCECFIGIALFLVVVLVIVALVFKLK